MVVRFDTRIDVSESVGLNKAVETAVWVYMPKSNIDPDNTVVVFAFPGGTYCRSYYDLAVPGHEGYSLARHLATLGHIVVVCDHIGIGDSTPYEPFAALTKDVVVRADSATVQGVLARLSAGTLAEGLAPVINPFTIGVGHSWGGTFLTFQQAMYHSFDAVAILGSSRVPPAKLESLLRNVAFRAYRRRMPDPTRPPRELFHRFFHDKSVPEEVVAADDALAVRVYCFVFEDLNSHRRISREAIEAARQIDVPTFLGFGDRDVSRDPHREISAYPNSSDVTTFVLAQSAHCMNFAETRRLLFDRLAGWVIAMSSTYRVRGI